jgi:hypothetical protein
MESIIFLGINRVLQSSRKRFENVGRLEQMHQDLLIRFPEVDYRNWDEFDVAACYYDWSVEAVELLRKLIISETDGFVLSSEYRELGRWCMRDLFKMHGLDRHFLDQTEKCGGNYGTALPKVIDGILGHNLWSKEREIFCYLVKHPEIKRFAILEDARMDSRILSPHAVNVTVPFRERHFKKAIEALSIDWKPPMSWDDIEQALKGVKLDEGKLSACRLDEADNDAIGSQMLGFRQMQKLRLRRRVAAFRQAL